MKLSPDAIIEGLLFVSDTPLGLDRLAELLPEYERSALKKMLPELQLKIEQRNSGIRLTEVAGGWQLRTVPELAPYLTRLLKSKPVRFSHSALETLAIVAYRQPVTRQEIEHLRGVDAGAVLKTLLEKKLVKITGRKEVPGRPIIYGTTKEFLAMFNLKDLKGLPALKEIQLLDSAYPGCTSADTV